MRVRQSQRLRLVRSIGARLPIHRAVRPTTRALSQSLEAPTDQRPAEWYLCTVRIGCTEERIRHLAYLDDFPAA